MAKTTISMNIFISCMLLQLSSQAILKNCLSLEDFDKMYSKLMSGSQKGVSTNIKDHLAKNAKASEFKLPWSEGDKKTTVSVRKYEFITSDLKPALEAEIEILLLAQKSPYVVSFKGCFDDLDFSDVDFEKSAGKSQSGPEFPSIYMIFEKSYGDFGSDSKPKFPLAILRKMDLKGKLSIYLKFAEALKSLHALGIVHENIQESSFHATDKKIALAKIANFDFAGMEGEFVVLNAKQEYPLTKMSDIQALGKTIEFMEKITVEAPALLAAKPGIPSWVVKLQDPVHIEGPNSALSKQDILYARFKEVVQRCIYDATGDLTAAEVAAYFKSLIDNKNHPSLINAIDLNYAKKVIILDSKAPVVSLKQMKKGVKNLRVGGIIAMHQKGGIDNLPKFYKVPVQKVQADPRNVQAVAKNKSSSNQLSVSPSEELARQDEMKREFADLGSIGFKFEQRVVKNQKGSVYEKHETTTTSHSWFGISYWWFIGAAGIMLVAFPIVCLCKKRSRNVQYI